MAGPSVEVNAIVEATGSNYLAGEVLTFTSQSLIAAGFTSPNPTLDLEITLDSDDIVTTTSSISNKVKYIKISNTAVNGFSILPFIQDSGYITFNLTGAQDYLGNLIQGYQTWYISNVSLQDDNNPATEDATLIIVNQGPSSDAVSSYDTQFYDLSFSASGIFSYYSTASGEDPNVVPSTGITQSVAQGYFPPVPTFPTESFFRGWGKSNYFEGNPDGSVYRVETGSGFSSDELGNFNTGSVEVDNDSSIPYTASRIPWFMNVAASTFQALNNSSLVGDLATDKLQLYTGSITASAVQIGPSFDILDAVTPVEGTVAQTAIQVQQPAFLSTSCGSGLTAFLPTNFNSVPITVTTSDQTLSWNVSILYSPDASGWVSVDTLSGTGNAVIQVSVDDDLTPSTGEFTTRSARVFVTNANNPSNSVFCEVEQTIVSADGEAGIIPAQNNP